MGRTFRTGTFRSADILAAAAVAASAGLAYVLLPGGSAVRIVLGLAMVFLVPGYLLLEAAARPSPSLRPKLLRVLAAIGVSPAVVGLAALATALVPGGFKPAAIVLAVTVACAALAGLALWRRMPHAASQPAGPT